MQPTTELPQTFWDKVRKTDDCWLWTAAVQSKGYGSFAIGGITYSAHRLAYEDANGPIPARTASGRQRRECRQCRREQQARRVKASA